MIFDDLKNIAFYKGIHPNLDKAIVNLILTEFERIFTVLIEIVDSLV